MSEAPPPLNPEPPLDSNPPVQQAAPERNWAGWIAVSIVSFLLIALQTSQYLGTEKGERSFTAQESTMKTSAMQGRMMKDFFGRMLTSDKQKADMEKQMPAQEKTTARQALDEVKKYAGENAQAATIAIASSMKLGQEPPKEAMERLRKSPNPKMRALVENPKELSPLQKATLWEVMKTGSYSQKVLAAHTLKEVEGGAKAQAMIITDEEVSGMGWAILIGFCVLGLGVCSGALGLIMHFTGYWKSKRLPLEFHEADKYAVWMGVFFVLLIFVPILVISLMNGTGVKWDPGLKTLLPFGFLTLVFISLILLPGKSIKISMRKVLGDWKPWPRQILVGLGAFTANFPLILILAMIVMAATAPFKDVLPQPSHPINEMMGSGSGPWTMFLAGTAAVLLAPILEELAFRGIFFPALARVMSPLAACLIQGFVFAAIHPQGLPAIPMLMVIGVTGAFVAWKEGSLLPAMVMHAAHNFTILMIGMRVI